MSRRMMWSRRELAESNRARLPYSGLLISGLLSMGGCGSTAAEPDVKAAVATVVVDPAAPTLQSIGETVTLVATAMDARGNPLPSPTFTWSSTRADVASVGPAGRVTAVADGVAEIQATAEGVTGQGRVEVSQRATQVVFTQQAPSVVLAGEPMGSGVGVEVRDAGGTVVTGWSDTIVVTLVAGSGEASLVGDTAVAPVSGKATFDFILDQPGEGYVLGVRSGALETNESEPFDVWEHPVHVDSLRLEKDTAAIGGGSPPYTVWLTNVGEAVEPVIVQAYIEQSGDPVPAGGRAVRCGNQPIGTLPKGSCSVSFGLYAGGDVGLVPGPAEATFQVSGGVAEPFVLVVKKPIVLIEYVPPEPPAVSLGSAALDQPVLGIGGPPVYYEATFVNDEAEDVPNVVIQGWIDQGTASRAAHGSSARCGLDVGTVPVGECVMKSSAGASNTAAGTGTLVPGDAVLRLNLSVRVDYVRLDLGELSIPITLVEYVPPEPPAVSLGNVATYQTVLVIDGTGVSYGVNIINDEVDNVPDVSVQAWIDQGAAYRAAGGGSVGCGLDAGTIPPGTCISRHTAYASNMAAGSGTLVPGDAFLRLELYVYIDDVKVDLGEVSIPITLVN